MTTLTNRLDQPLAVYYFDPSGAEQIIEAPGLGTVSFDGEIHPSTQALLERGHLRYGTGTPITTSQPLAFPLAGVPQIWCGTWRPNALYKKGSTVAFSGKTFVAAITHASATPPTLSNVQWQLSGLVDANAFFEVELANAEAGAVVYRDGAGPNADWVVGKLTNANIDNIQTSAISDLGDVLAGYIPKAGGTMTGALLLAGNPVSSLEAAAKQYVDLHLPKAGGTMTGALVLSLSPTQASHAVRRDYVDGLLDQRLAKAGGTMTGAVVLSGNPSSALEAAPKQYVDLRLALAGGTMTGPLILSGNPTTALEAAPKQFVELHLAKAGGTMTGALTLSGNPASALHAAPKQYVDLHLPKSGGTLTGALVLAGDPTTGLHPVTLQYLDSRLGNVLTLEGGILTGPLTLPDSPSETLHAATKGYVDAGNAARLLLSGGEMTGAITGAHGLLQKSGGTTQRMTGDLSPLLRTDATAAEGVGLWESSEHGVPGFKKNLISTMSVANVVTDDYTALDTDGIIVLDAGSTAGNVRFGDPADYPYRVYTVVRKGGNKHLATVLASGRVYNLADHEDSISFVPNADGWMMVNRHRGAAKPVSFGVFLTAGSESSNVILVSLEARSLAVVDGTVSAISVVAGTSISFTCSSSGWRIGDSFTITGLDALAHPNYNGDYVVNSLSTGPTILTALANKTDSGTGTGKITGVPTSALTSSQRLRVAISASPNDPWDPVDDIVLAIQQAGDGRLYGTSTDGLHQSLLIPSGAATLKVTDVSSEAQVVYLHLLDEGYGALGPLRTNSVTNAAAYGANISAAVVHVNGTTFTVNNTYGFEVGDEVVISGTSLHNGTFNVVSITDSTHVVIDVTFAGAEASGTITSANAVSLSVNSSASFAAGQVVRTEGVTALGNFHGQFVVLGVDTGVIAIRSSFDSSLNKVGTLFQMPILRLTFAA